MAANNHYGLMQASEVIVKHILVGKFELQTCTYVDCHEDDKHIDFMYEATNTDDMAFMVIVRYQANVPADAYADTETEGLLCTPSGDEVLKRVDLLA